ncbi:hypothetical protein D8Y22_03380 [Salinadaptatus halalkaliphilus]|uniref:AMP-dependent synthetase n=1 Tax=Salinadaptatus halalkaliphilus TaxID=2419781 RepID=A0A4S3TQ06_9EURY|nr:AMP-binding protein [Salinadaptatus halalkaliphilus]THE66326.1 hypothetical protein D8Y22_03380 [Salinadaptatus halalkaliphilus]
MSEVPPESAEFSVDREIWPDDLPRTLPFPGGRKPIHEIVADHGRDRPDAPAVTYYGNTLTWAELDARADAFAATLSERGHGLGDVCGIYLQNAPQFLVAYYGAQRAGLAVTPLNPQFKAPAVARQCRDSGASVVVTATDTIDVVREAREDDGVDLAAEDVIVTAYSDYAGDDGPYPDELTAEPAVADVLEDETALSTAVSNDADVDLPSVGLADPALLQYTGGTTGLPKGCVHTHWNVLFKGTTTAAVRAMGPEDVSLGTMPMFHVAGKQRYCDALGIVGNHAVLLTRYDPETVMDAIDSYGVTSTWLAVPSIEEIVDHPAVDDYDLTSLSARREFTNCSSFGTTLTREISEAWREHTGAGVQESGYGLTETHTTDTHTYGEERIEPGFVGQACYGVEIEIRDFETNETLPPGEPGEIVLRSPATMSAYLNRPDATDEVLEDDGFLHTGDVGRKTDEGYLYFLGRRKDTLKVSGHTVSPREVELVLAEHESLEDVIVVGAPHERRGSVLEAHVIPAAGTDGDDLEEALLSFAEGNLAEYKVPKDIVVRESFPRTDVGKVDRVAYRETLPDGYE